MKIQMKRTRNWIFGWEIWNDGGITRLDIGFWHWHIYVYLREKRPFSVGCGGDS